MIADNPSWNIYDATKVQACMDCPRKYFFEYCLGWRSATPNIHLEYGKAFHKAMEHLIIHHSNTEGYSARSIADAWELFTAHYREHFSPEFDEVYAPKDPANTLKALVKYADEYKDDKFKPLYTEIAGTVPIGESRVLHFRMDSILETDDGIKSREHKTGSTLSRQWVDQWALSFQSGVYNHVLYCLYPREEVWGVEINGVFLQKKENKFQRVPSRRSTEMMNAWLWLANYWVAFIEEETEKLRESDESDAVLQAFPQNTQSCTKYFGCSYLDYCMAWANPLAHINQVPMNMKVEWWNPAEEETTAKNVFYIER